MTGLLDTHTFIWWDSDVSRLSSKVLEFLGDASNMVLLSVVSVWEMVIKMQLEKITIRAPLTAIIADQQANGMQVLPVTLAHVLTVETLPIPHKDPFDRLLVAQANAEGAVLLSADLVFAQYPVNILW